MTKTLIITAHPSSRGLTHGIANVVADARKEKGGEVEILDLYNTDLKQDFFAYENIHEIPVDPNRDALQKKIMEADELIFVHPVWWLSMPAIMKNFIDQNIQARFAYKYVEGKRVGLLKGKTARIYVTCDAPKMLYLFLAAPYFTIWVAGILVFCGVKVNSFTVIRNRGFKDDIERAKYLSRLKKRSFRKHLILRIFNWLADIIQ